MTGIIYCYTNKVNGKKYVGQTMHTLEERAGKDGHRYDRKFKFGQAIAKYSIEAFDVEILESLEATTKQELRLLLNEREKYYIELLDTYRNGYNSDYGGNSREHSDETKLKIRETKLANQKLPGYKHPNKGKRFSEETRAKLSAARMGKDPWNKGLAGTLPGRQIRCVETNIVYPSIVVAANDVGILPQSISQVVRGITKTAGGYHWEYVD